MNIHIESDFKDFYDYLSGDSGLIYRRNLSDSRQRGSALKFLKGVGINTIELKQVNRFSSDDKLLVVYTDTKAHQGLGKKICDVNNAKIGYSNYVASKYIDSNNITIKFLQIGERRFQLTFQSNPMELTEGRLIAISELKPAYNRLFGLPIFSIDYIQDGDVMVATDFNEVENLARLGMNYYLTPEEVVNQIEKSLIAYNKIERT